MRLPVKVDGENADGDAFSEASSSTINPVVIGVDTGDYDVGTLAWNGADGGSSPDPRCSMYPGHIVKVAGYGFKAGEEVGLKVYDDDGDLVGSAVIRDGAEAQTEMETS